MYSGQCGSFGWSINPCTKRWQFDPSQGMHMRELINDSLSLSFPKLTNKQTKTYTQVKIKNKYIGR